MTRCTTAELYRMFLDSDWWINLSRSKRRAVKKCQRCGRKKKLQSHHIRYAENWFDTKLEDLEVLCRRCHELEHNIVPVKFTPNTKSQASQWRQGNKKRSWKGPHRKRSRKERAKARNRKERLLGIAKSNAHAYRALRGKPRMHWVQRGTSSN